MIYDTRKYKIYTERDYKYMTIFVAQNGAIIVAKRTKLKRKKII